MAGKIDHSKAWLVKGGYLFEPLRLPAQGRPLRKSGLETREELLVFERRGAQRALVMRQMAYHHVAQGELAGEPYLITF